VVFYDRARRRGHPMTTGRDRPPLGEEGPLGALRAELVVEEFAKGGQRAYRLIAPSGFAFDLYDLEYHVARAFDGIRTAVQVSSTLATTGHRASARQVLSFHRELSGMGFIDEGTTAGASTRVPTDGEWEEGPATMVDAEGFRHARPDGGATVVDPIAIERLLRAKLDGDTPLPSVDDLPAPSLGGPTLAARAGRSLDLPPGHQPMTRSVPGSAIPVLRLPPPTAPPRDGEEPLPLPGPPRKAPSFAPPAAAVLPGPPTRPTGPTNELTVPRGPAGRDPLPEPLTVPYGRRPVMPSAQVTAPVAARPDVATAPAAPAPPRPELAPPIAPRPAPMPPPLAGTPMPPPLAGAPMRMPPPLAGAPAASPTPGYPRFEPPTPGNYPQPAVAYPVGRPPVVPADAAPPPTRRAVVAAVLAGATLIGATYALLYVDDGPAASATATGAAVPTPIDAGAAPDGIVAIPGAVEHPRGVVTAPVAGEIVAAELRDARPVASDERLFVLRQAFDGTGQPERLLIRAPFAGLATPKTAEGKRVARGAVLAELVDETAWQATVEIDGAITTKGRCRVRLPGAGETTCVIATIEPGARPRVLVRFAAADAPWLGDHVPEIVLTP
jgi:hypothetical protein